MRRVVAALIAVAAASPAAAVRIVDYPVDEAVAVAAATEQGLALAPLPPRGAIDFGLDVTDGVDHDVVRGGIACSAYSVRNPLGAFVRRVFAAVDRDGVVPGADSPTATVAVRLDRAATLSRCVLTGEMVGKCLTRVTLDGTITRTGTAAAPFHIVVDQAAKSFGLCAGLTRGIGLVSRAAVVELVALASAPDGVAAAPMAR